LRADRLRCRRNERDFTLTKRKINAAYAVAMCFARASAKQSPFAAGGPLTVDGLGAGRI
jgi:hypothetical protein